MPTNSQKMIRRQVEAAFADTERAGRRGASGAGRLELRDLVGVYVPLLGHRLDLGVSDRADQCLGCGVQTSARQPKEDQQRHIVRP
jgi:hypothetical protein